MRDNRTLGSRFFHLCAALLCLLALGRPARAQQPEGGRAPQEPGDVVRVSTELVETPVAVFDRQGRFVDGLKQEQFELRADGRVVPVSFFERVGGHPQAGATPPRATSAAGRDSAHARGRRIIFFVDDLHLAAGSVEHVRRSLLRFIDGEMGEGDEVAVVSASGQVGFLQQFTGERAVLRAAVRRIKYRRAAAPDTFTPAMSEYVALKIAQGDRAALRFYTVEMLRSLQFTYALPKYGGKEEGYIVGSDLDHAERMVTQRARSILLRTDANTQATLSALENFLRSSGGLPGRKHVLFISDGFLTQASDNFAQRLERITDAAARAGGVVYTLDARSLACKAGARPARLDTDERADKFSYGEAEASGAALQSLAANTGGRSLTESEDFGASVGRAVEETFNYYVLAWRPETEAQREERFRQIQVSVVGRPDLTARVPRGFLASGSGCPQKPARPPGADSKAATPSPSQEGGLPTRLRVEFLNTPDDRMTLMASTQVAADALAYGGSGSEAAAVDLAGVVLDEHGNQAASFGTRLNVEPRAAGAAGSERPVVIYKYPAPLKPGIYQVRVAARDNRSGRSGRDAAWVEIPDLAGGRLTLSSLFLGMREAGAGAPAGGGATPVQFSVDHRFRRDGPLSFFLFIYNASGAELSVEASVIRDGRARLTVPPQKAAREATAADPRRIPFGGSFPLKSLPPGDYLLRVTVTDERARTTASRDAKFVVE